MQMSDESNVRAEIKDALVGVLTNMIIQIQYDYDIRKCMEFFMVGMGERLYSICKDVGSQVYTIVEGDKHE